MGSGVPFQNIGDSYDVGYGDFYMSAGMSHEVESGSGWLKLNNSPSGVTLLGSAMAYDGEVLTVGVIPEPSTLAFVGVFGAGMWFVRRKFRR